MSNEEMESALQEIQDIGQEMTEEVVEKPKRSTKKPDPVEVEFKVIRGFTWHGRKLEAGETYSWLEDDYNAMMYDVNLRTDRQIFVVPA